MDILQNQFAINPEGIAEQLNLFWLPIWQRDTHDLDFLRSEDYQDLSRVLGVIPQIPEVQVNMRDPNLWKSAIEKLKAHSARGSDKISAQELKMLPDKLIDLLAAVMARYGKGLLSQRGSADTAYGFQFYMEKAKLDSRALSRVTLDLKKCFNNVKWRFGCAVLQKLGVPRPLIVQWMLSIGCMTRVWLVQGDVFCAGTSSTGFPEGDSWSVLVMIGIANSWCHYMRSQCLHEGLILSPYADNWAWILSQCSDHSRALAATIFLTEKAGLSLDFQKAWFWCTHASDVNMVQTHVATVPNGEKIQQKTTASDLGHQLHYSGGARKGVNSERFDKGLKRLPRLKHMRHSLDVKEVLLRSSILPAAFYGCTIRPPATESIEQFRSLAARALLGDGYNLNPAIVLLCTQNGILDPEVWIILQILRAARNFLLKSNPDVSASFLRIASRFQGNLHNVSGPASCLAFCLRKLHWHIDSAGYISVMAFLKFHLAQNSFQRFARFVTQAWQEKHVMMHSQRTKWFNMPDICQRETTRALACFNSQQRVALLRELAGRFQLANQKAKWLPDQDDTCQYCEAIDSREHRLLQCPVGTLAIAALNWLRTLRWPVVDAQITAGPMGYNTGIRWIEMAISFMFFHGIYLPILRDDAGGVKRLAQPSSYAEAMDDNMAATEAGTMIQKLIENVAALVPQQLLFPCDRGKTSSLYHQGAKIHVTGLRLRPQLPNQGQVAAKVQRLLSTQHSLQSTPKINAPEDGRLTFQGTWQFRQDKAKLKMILVRKLRKEIAGQGVN
eukprot:s3693_g3.t1